MRSTAVIEKAEFCGFAYERHQCSSEFLGTTVSLGRLIPKTCVLESKPIGGTLYILHGGIGDDRFTIDIALLDTLTADLLQVLHEKRIQLVLPFIGRSFLHDHPEKSKSAYSSYFEKEVLPLVEASTQTTAATRYLCGYSMGGQAALNFFGRHPEVFAGVAAIFPTLITFDYTSPQEVAAFSARTKIADGALTKVIPEFVSEFVGREDFLRHDPLTLFANLPANTLAGRHIHFGAGSRDDYGLHEGCRRLHELLNLRNIPHFYDEIPDGQHDVAVLTTLFSKMIRSIFTAD